MQDIVNPDDRAIVQLTQHGRVYTCADIRHP